MKPKTLILMVVAVVCGLAASYMTSRLLAERQSSNDEDQKVTILVAKQNISTGSLIKDPEKFFVEKAFTKGEEPKKALRSFDQLKDRVLNKGLSAEQFVTSDDLYGKDQQGLSGALPAGMRAVAIHVSAETLAGGFVLPNSHVDVILTVRRGDSDSYAYTFLQNMLVLAVDQAPTRDERATMLASTVTLAATPEDTQRISLATTMGELRLTLRKYDDIENNKARMVTPRDLTRASVAQNTDGQPDGDGTGGKSGGAGPWGTAKIPEVKPEEKKPEEKKPEPPPPAPPKPPKTHTLTIYNSETLTKAVFVLGEDDSVSTTDVQKTPTVEPAKNEKPQAEKPADNAKSDEEKETPEPAPKKGGKAPTNKQESK